MSSSYGNLNSFGNLSMKQSALQRGLAASRSHNWQEAATCFEQALQEKAGDVQAMTLLGQSLCNLGQRQQGVVWLLKAGRLQLEATRAGGDAGKVLEIVSLLQQRGDFAGALELLDVVVALNAGEFRAFQLLAVTYAQLNRKNDALQAGERALQLAPDNAMMQVFLASLEADLGRNDEARRRLEQVLAGTPHPREAFRAHKELARVLDKQREFARIFPHLHAAAALAGQLPEYAGQNAALIPGLLQANRAGYDRELLGRWAGAVFPSSQPAPVFVVGFMRSGTTLTQEVLDAHPEVLVADEADFVWAMQNELNRMDRSNASTSDKLRKLDQAGIEHLREFYWQRVRGRFGDDIGKRLFVDKFTMNTIDLGLINVVFPDAKVLFVMRDPRDVCLSCFMQLMVPTPITVHLLDWQKTARIYAQVMDWWMYLREQMTLDYIEFRYEDAVGAFEPTFRRVFDFLGLEWDAAVVDFHRRAAEKVISTPSRTQVSQPLYASSVARWRRFEPEFADVAGLLQPYVAAFGYDT